MDGLLSKSTEKIDTVLSTIIDHYLFRHNDKLTLKMRHTRTNVLALIFVLALSTSEATTVSSFKELTLVHVHKVLSPKESDVFTDHGMVSFEFYASTKATHRVKRTVYDYIVMVTLTVFEELSKP